MGTHSGGSSQQRCLRMLAAVLTVFARRLLGHHLCDTIEADKAFISASHTRPMLLLGI